MEEGQVDEELLDKLGWSEDQLRRFMQRWERLAQEQPPTTGQSETELDEALRSLGLRPKDNRLDAGGVRQDDLRGIEQGRRSRPPSQYEDLFRAFNQSLSRGRAD